MAADVILKEKDIFHFNFTLIQLEKKVLSSFFLSVLLCLSLIPCYSRGYQPPSTHLATWYNIICVGNIKILFCASQLF